MLGHKEINQKLVGTVLSSRPGYEAYGRKVEGYISLGSLADGCTLLDAAKALVELGMNPKHIGFHDTSGYHGCDYDRYDFPETNEEFKTYENTMGRKYDFYRIHFKVSYFKASNWEV